MRIRLYKGMLCLFLFITLIAFSVSCGRRTKREENLEGKGTGNQSSGQEVSFQVCKEEELPDELKDMIEEKKEEEFELTYENSAFMYIAVGYGKQSGGEYVAAVRNLWETEERIMVEMILISLSHGEEKERGETSLYPYIVLRMEKTEKPVFFL